MNWKENVNLTCRKVNEKLQYYAGFSLHELSWENFILFLYRPTDPSSLAVSRMLFGLSMVLDIPEERGGAEIDIRWGDPKTCHFPLFPSMKPLALPYMVLVYAAMWIGALGITLGYRFRTTSIMFLVPYWYLFLLEKSYWNNHSYLFGLVGLLFATTQASNYLSLDAYLNSDLRDRPVPYWNYFIIKYQFFILYFVAGLKKASSEWLSGYAMKDLSHHWVFDPFTLFLSTQQTDYLIVHWFACLFDMSICLWLMWQPSRPLATIFCAAFHLMNTRLFSIGMFPWVCLATMPLFYSFDWPKQVKQLLSKHFNYIKIACKQIHFFERKIIAKPHTNVNNIKCAEDNVSLDNDGRDICEDSVVSDDIEMTRTTDGVEERENRNSEQKNNDKMDNEPQCEVVGKSERNISWDQRCVVYWLVFYMVLQGFLPYSHFITKGYNNWTNGLYGYSWDMMMYHWDTILVIVKVVDKKTKQQYFLNPKVWVPNDRWTRHGDMVYQYAQCINRNIEMDLLLKYENTDTKTTLTHSQDETSVPVSEGVSIYVDVWCSMNGRLKQRMFNPNVDLLMAKWSPFEKVSWLMPLLTKYEDWRDRLKEIQENVYSWNNYTEVLFVADFSGMQFENYIDAELENVTLTVLDGQVVFEPLPSQSKNEIMSLERSEIYVYLSKGESQSVPSGAYHKVNSVGFKPTSYMYTFTIPTKTAMKSLQTNEKIYNNEDIRKEKLPLIAEFKNRLQNMVIFLQLIKNSLLDIIFGVPLSIRMK